MQKPTLILASQSIGRKHLLEKLGVSFEVMPSTVKEDDIVDQNPIKMIQERARRKAEDVVQKILTTNRELRTMNHFIIAADSEAVLGKISYGKAIDIVHAKRIVKALMGRTHEFVTATTILSLRIPRSPKLPIEEKRWEHVTKTLVTCRNMSDLEIDQYASRYDFSRFAAGYALNETPWDWVTKIDGSYTNVVGLPFEVILPILREYGLLKTKQTTRS